MQAVSFQITSEIVVDILSLKGIEPESG